MARGGGASSYAQVKRMKIASVPSQAASRRGLYAAALLCLSGGAALVYQVLWIKQLSLVVGVEVHAVTAAVSAFFAGLGFGGFFLGRIADKRARPARFYAGLEVAVAVAGIATTLILARLAPGFVAVEMRSPWLAWVIVFLLVGFPAFLMGGTLPALVRALEPTRERIGRVGGWLYAANTTGAIAGALLPVFVLIPAFGVLGTAIAAAAMNLAAGAAALRLDQPAKAPVSQNEGAQRIQGDARFALALYAVAGGIALGYEVVWSQIIVQFISTRSFAFSVVLATYLSGLVLGAMLAAPWAHRIRKPWLIFGCLIAAAGLLALFEVALLGRWLIFLQSYAEASVFGWTGSQLAGMCARFAVAAASIVLGPTILLGAAFPLALRLVANGRDIGRDVGAVIALNTIGGIVGSLLTGFVLIPTFGLVHTLACLALVAAAVGLLAATRETAARRLGIVAAAGIAISAGALALLTPPERLADLLTQSRRGALTFYEESQGGTVAVLEQSLGRNRFKRLYIQGVSNSGDAMSSRRYMRLQALLPLIVHADEPRSALVIGLGTGITAGALLQYPTLERRVVAELMPAVVRAASNFDGNYGAASDSRLDIRLRDGRRELLRSDERYGLITLEPPPPAAAGVVNLYSRDFYELAAKRLENRGIVAQWLPLHTQNGEDTQSLVKAFLAVFPHASLWSTDFHEMLLVGSMAPLELDAARIASRLALPGVAQSLREVGIGSTVALLATWVTDRTGLEMYAADALPVTDNRPRIEYGTWMRSGEFQRVLPTILALRSQPPLVNANPELTAAIERERGRLYTFYAAGLHAQNGDRSAWARDIDRLMREDGDNPYYNWFTGGTRRVPASRPE